MEEESDYSYQSSFEEEDLFFEYNHDYQEDLSPSQLEDNSSKDKNNIEIAKFNVLSIQDLIKKKDDLVNRTAQLLDLDNDTTQLLLENYRWKPQKLLEKYMENQEEALFQAGIPQDPKCSDCLQTIPDFTCPIMFESGEDVKFFSLSCNHKFCSLCYSMHISTKINNRIGYRINCPEYKCNLSLKESQIKLLLNDDSELNKYIMIIIQNYVEASDTLTWCPGVDCDKAIELPSFNKVTSRYTVSMVTCSCGTSFCFNCKNQDHRPALCQLLDMWLQKCRDDSETLNWLSSNTKDCPTCKYPIEKNGGCNHITCRNCAYQFCWVCLQDWNKHRDNYSCNIFVESASYEDEELIEVSKKNDIAIDSRKKLERYMFHYIRFDNQEKSIKLAQDLLSRTEKKIDTISKNNGFSWIEIQFLKDAVLTLTLCRNTLKWSFAVSYYMEKNNMSAIFEDNQSDLSCAVEDLNELVESKITPENIDSTRRKILDLTAYVSDRNRIFLSDTMGGYSEDRYKFMVQL
ncbi:E3 ubiquitin-protein ligase dbl4 [Smittium mucronatum]|uniref:RBR-type E3 ubiquitin transferase n=1 Tax=Smittium mucronatum TaxID=133383 RepID=A0A1R0GT91_9FUNG|nr:E3 ubiquitin-protein ligase dbl4 [Smittium mucronatum]